MNDKREGKVEGKESEKGAVTTDRATSGKGASNVPAKAGVPAESTVERGPKTESPERWFEKQVLDADERPMLVRGRVLEGPLWGKRVTRRLTYRVRFDDGREDETTLRPSEIFTEAPAVVKERETTGKKETKVPVESKQELESKQKEAVAGSVSGHKAEPWSAAPEALNGPESGGNGNGTVWRAREVLWFCERLCAQYGASPAKFRDAWRAYEASELPEGVRIEYRKRKDGSREDRKYTYEYRNGPEQALKTFKTDSLVKLQQFFDERGDAKPAAVLSARGGGRGRGPQLSPAEVENVRARLEKEGWRIDVKTREAGLTAGEGEQEGR